MSLSLLFMLRNGHNGARLKTSAVAVLILLLTGCISRRVPVVASPAAQGNPIVLQAGKTLALRTAQAFRTKSRSVTTPISFLFS